MSSIPAGDDVLDPDEPVFDLPEVAEVLGIPVTKVHQQLRDGHLVAVRRNGVIVIPPGLAEEVVDAALAQEVEDAWVAARVAEGHPVDGLFPMNKTWRARYDAETQGPDA